MLSIYLKKNATKIILLCILIPAATVGQVPNHTFPRTAIWQWSGAPPEWYAKFDLAFTRPKSSNFISKVKAINPNIIFLYAKDINKSNEKVDNFPKEWMLYDSKGSKIELYGPSEFWTNLADVCPLVNGQQLIDFLPEYYADLVSEADGFASDGLYSRAHLKWRMFDDVDMDRNGVNDLDEHGESWIIEHWGNGVERMLEKMRQLLGDKIILINTGSTDTPGKSFVNGYVSEHETSVDNWAYTRQQSINLNNAVFQPSIFLINNNPDSKDPNLYRPTKDYFSYMRFGLARATLIGDYFEFEDIDNGQNEHYWNRYYDEFDLDLGHPTASMQEVKNGVWIRFFDKGAVILNVSGNNVTITAQELGSLTGYNGPYHRFLGGQDPDVNNGKQFSSISLIGYTYLGYHDDRKTNGDAIFLVKSPQTVVADLIIDNVEMGTSPGCKAVSLSGGFLQEEDCNAGSDFYSLRCSWNPGTFPYAISLSGSGEARFVPNIGVSGKYKVFEWHGSLPGSQASSVRYEINHSSGSTSKIVDQKTKTGQWNSLGTFSFSNGTSGNVTIYRAGADGPVMADAIKFVFSDGKTDDSVDITSPIPPKNVKVEHRNF